MRIVIAEDAVLLRAGLTRLLDDAGEEVVAAVGDPVALFDVLARQQPDLAILDVRMPPTFTDEGIRAAVRIRAEHPAGGRARAQPVRREGVRHRAAGRQHRVGRLPAEGPGGRRGRVHRGGASGRRSGGTALDPEVVAQLLARSRRRDPLETLTDREREVLSLMAEGRSNGAIAAELVVSDGAVEKHVRNIFTKLDLPPDASDHRRVLAVLRYLES